MSLGRYGSVFDPEARALTAFGVQGELTEYLHPTYGYQIYRYGYAALALAVGVTCSFITTSSLSVVVTPAFTAKANICGVKQVACAVALSFQWFLVRGRGIALADAGGWAADALLTPLGAAGGLDDVAIAGFEHGIVAQSKAVVAGGATGVVEVCVLG
jgi:hypothetical protein